MLKLSLTVVSAIVGLAWGQPAVAQDSPPTAQVALDAPRLAAAKVTIDYIFPSGTYGKMFGASFSQVMNQTMDSMTTMPIADFVKSTGLPQDDVAKLGSTTVAEVMEIMDPAFKQRRQATMEAMMPALNQMMASMEPTMRQALVEAYARRFTLDQLNDMNRFFATPSGSAYASNSMLIMMDPEVVGRVSKDMPKMMQDFIAQLPAIQKKVEAATAGLPKPRDYADLTASEKAKLASLLGVDEKDLGKTAAAASKKRPSRPSSRR